MPEPDRASDLPAPGLEGALRSPLRRALVLAALVAFAALLMTAHIADLNSLMRYPQPWWRILAHQVASWTLWGLAGILLVGLARRLRAFSRSWLLFFAIEIPLSIGVAAALAEAHDRIAGWIYEEPRGRPPPRPPLDPEGRPRPPLDPEGRPRPPPPGDPIPGGALVPPTPGTPAAAERRGYPVRLRFNLAVYWIVLGIGAGVEAFLRAGERGRLAAKLRLRSTELEAELARAQLTALRGQLHPHFFFNSLHAVAGLVREHRDGEALRVIAALGDLLRTTLDQHGAPEVALREELRVTELYLGIEKIRFGSRLAVRIDVDPSVLDARVPSLLLQPLVENAVRYGIEPRTGGGEVRVTARSSDADLEIEVADDGPGFPAWVLGREAPPAGRAEGSIGLSNDRERLRILYGDRQSFELANAPAGGALVRIRLPLSRTGDPRA